MLDFDQIKELISLVARNRLERVEVERSGFRIVIVGRSAPAAAGTAMSVAGGEAMPALEPQSGAVGPAAASGSAALATEPEVAVHLLTSPIVGTFYGAASPDAEPYARVGDRVRKGQVLCIVEAMKLMNEIESDADGVVVEVFPKNAQPVEFGERLFAIRTD